MKLIILDPPLKLARFMYLKMSNHQGRVHQSMVLVKAGIHQSLIWADNRQNWVNKIRNRQTIVNKVRIRQSIRVHQKGMYKLLMKKETILHQRLGLVK